MPTTLLLVLIAVLADSAVVSTVGITLNKRAKHEGQKFTNGIGDAIKEHGAGMVADALKDPDVIRAIVEGMKQ